MQQFKEFVNTKNRETEKQLGILQKVLQKEGLQVSDFRQKDEPYLFVKTIGNLSFGGVRIYKVGNAFAYRVQREESTHPYGKAYLLDVEEMFSDYIAEDMSEQKAGEKVVEEIGNEMRTFFDKSSAVEKEISSGSFDQSLDPLGQVAVQSTGTDYANRVHN